MGNHITAQTKKWVAVKVWSPDSQYDQQTSELKVTPPIQLVSMTPLVSLPLKHDLQTALYSIQRSIALMAVDAKEGCDEVLRYMDRESIPEVDEWEKYDQVAFRKAGVFVLRLTGEKEPPFTAGKSIMYEITKT